MITDETFVNQGLENHRGTGHIHAGHLNFSRFDHEAGVRRVFFKAHLKLDDLLGDVVFFKLKRKPEEVENVDALVRIDLLGRNNQQRVKVIEVGLELLIDGADVALLLDLLLFLLNFIPSQLGIDLIPDVFIFWGALLDAACLLLECFHGLQVGVMVVVVLIVGLLLQGLV